MDFDRTLYVAESEPIPEELFGHLRALPGRLTVAMYRAESRSGILMPLSGRLGADVGQVICESEIVPEGTEVFVVPYHGAWYEDFMGSGNRVVMLGVSVPIEESVPAMRQNGFVMPLFDWVLLERKARKAGIVHLDEFLPFEADIEAIGPDVLGWKAGDPVVYTSSETDLTFKFGNLPDSWVLVRAQQLHARIQE